MQPHDFQACILKWFDAHGRKELPWQHNKTPYRVWVSEIMLQQTQVTTVIPYYARFMQRFPDIASLAKAPEDDVLHLWAGLGYYSRARNLHRAAKMVVTEFQGEFPSSIDALQQLPGIGQSTAGAIMAIAFNRRATILDGNVKRVLARFLGVTEPINEKAVENKLWKIASEFAPQKRIAAYTQAMMDLGATLCVRGKPECERCPLQKNCVAHAQGIAALLPRKKAARAIPVKTATFVIFQRGDSVLLRKRPASGIWGGLWSLPEIAGEPLQANVDLLARQYLHVGNVSYTPLPAFRHTFSHYHLDIYPVLVAVKRLPAKIMDAAGQIWYNPRKPETIGLPKPIQTILRGLE